MKAPGAEGGCEVSAGDICISLGSTFNCTTAAEVERIDPPERCDGTRNAPAKRFELFCIKSGMVWSFVGDEREEDLVDPPGLLAFASVSAPSLIASGSVWLFSSASASASSLNEHERHTYKMSSTAKELMPEKMFKDRLAQVQRMPE